jgi:uncharacterized membrane-anchored protein
MQLQLPPDHLLRFTLHNELHARLPLELAAPTQISFFALHYLPNGHGPDHDPALDDLTKICEIGGAAGHAAPPAKAHQFRTTIGSLALKWERHTEFVTYTFSRHATFESPFEKMPAQQIPAAWLASVSGKTLAAIHLTIRDHRLMVPDLRDIAVEFADSYLVGARVSSGAAIVLTDFRVHEDGFSRVLVMDTKMGKRQGGRIVQRMFEIETYRMACLLALPVAREVSTVVTKAEIELAEMTTMLARADVRDEPALLRKLTLLAATVENQLANNGFRFGAARAYYAIVKRRIMELREERLSGVQTIEEFIERRLSPAMQTCETAAQRLHDLSERIAQSTALLQTRVDIEREQQNQALLASMNRRAKLQLRLQQTVEGLSVAAITYYAVGLVTYLAKGVRAMGLSVHVDVTTAISVPIIAASVWFLLKRFRRKLEIEGTETTRTAQDA